MPTSEKQSASVADLILAVENQLTAPARAALPAALEERFPGSGGTSRARRAAIAVLAGLIVYDLLVPLEAALMPDVARKVAIGQIGVATPLCLIGLFLVGRAGRPWRLATGAAMSIATMLGIWIPAVLSASALAPFCLTGLLLIATFVNLLCDTPFLVSVFTSFAAVALYCSGMAAVTWEEPLYAAYAIVVMVAATGFSLVANCRANRSERRAYLMMLREALHAEAVDDQNRELLELSHTDSLTGVYNRRFFDAELAASFDGDPKGRVAVMLIDVDHFKAYNDRYGHPAGDRCLGAVAGIMAQQLRTDIDLLARYGGEEFAVVLPNADMVDAATIADRVRRSVEELGMEHGGLPGQDVVTVSVGFASAERGRSSPAALVKAADAALYGAKQAGRNRVAPPLVPVPRGHRPPGR